MERRIFALAIGAALVAGSAQEAAAQGNKEYKGVTVKLNDDGSKFFRFITWHQIWTRYAELNPGTSVNGSPEDEIFDISLRRSRFLGFGKLSEDFLILIHVGINNQGFNSGGVTIPAVNDPPSDDFGLRNPQGPGKKPQVFVHDAWVEYNVLDRYLTFGAGLHYWHGLSRMTNASTLNFMALDSPIFTWPTIEATDQFARQIGIYAKGKVARLDYRVALNRAFVPGTNSALLFADNVRDALYNPSQNEFSTAGYFQWQFLDQESNTLPYTVGSYLGSKKVLNVGAGYYFHPKATFTIDDGDLEFHDTLLVSGDIFIDYPFADSPAGGALTAYLAYYFYDFGPNHIRNVGILNPGSGGSTFNGRGNAFPLIGSGNHFYGLVGYLLPEDLVAGQQVQPYASITVSDFEALDDPAFVLEGGVNWYLFGHHSKLTLHYRARPIFVGASQGELRADGPENTTITSDGFASEVILQKMIYF